MARESDLVLALELVTAGDRAFATKGGEPVGLETLDRVPYGVESYRAAAAKLRRDSSRWSLARGVQGIGIGQKITKGLETDVLAMRVYVEKKKPRKRLKNPVPKTVSVPEVGRVPTDVVEIGRVATEIYTDRARPAMPGCGLGHRDVGVGSLGCLVRRRHEDPRGLYILSNSHVLADSGRGLAGDPVYQPGPLDGGGRSADIIATLAEFVPFSYGAGYPNLVDAAIARVKSRRQVKREIRILGRAPVGVSRTLRRGMRVKKVGRTTDYTLGMVTDVHYRLRVRYGKGAGSPGRVAGLRDQVLCTRFTGPGDSGSLVLNDRNRAVGLHFAGSISTSIFNRIEHVLELLDIELA